MTTSRSAGGVVDACYASGETMKDGVRGPGAKAKWPRGSLAQTGRHFRLLPVKYSKLPKRACKLVHTRWPYFLGVGGGRPQRRPRLKNFTSDDIAQALEPLAWPCVERRGSGCSRYLAATPNRQRSTSREIDAAFAALVRERVPPSLLARSGSTRQPVIDGAGSPLGPIEPRSPRSPRGPVAPSLPSLLAAAISCQRLPGQLLGLSRSATNELPLTTTASCSRYSTSAANSPR
jgi:hypothetical protein